MTINTSIGLIGVALQVDKQTPAKEPTFVHGLTGGQTFQLDRSVASDPVSCGVRAGTDSHVESIVPGVDFETYGYGDVLPLYLYGVMGKIVSSTNDEGEAKYKHVVTLGDILPYLTFWGRIGQEYTRVDGGKIDTLELEFEGNNPLSWGVTVLGIDAELGLDGFPGEIDPSCFDGYFVTTGGKFWLDTASDTPAEAPVVSGSLSLANSCTAEPLAGMVTPGDVEEGKLVSSGSVTVKPNDMRLYRRMITGSDEGTKPTGDMVYGSFDWKFRHNKNPNWELEIKAERVPFTAEFPDVDPEGGAAQVEFSFDDIGIASRDGSPVTAIIRNDTKTYDGETAESAANVQMQVSKQ